MKIFNFEYAKSINLTLFFAVITSIIIFIVTMVFAIFVLFYIKNDISQYESDLSTLRTSITAMLGQAVKLDNTKKDEKYSITQDMVDSLKNEYNPLSYIIITVKKDDEDVEIFKRNYIDEDTTDLSPDAKANIKEISQSIGDYSIIFGLPNKDYIQTYYDNMFDVLFQLLIFCVIIGTVVGYFMSIIISGPLEKLSKAAKQLSSGNFDVKITKTTFSEVNTLVEAYNEMASQLNELYSSLELKVQERTIALEAANYKLQETQAMMVHSEKMRALGELVAGIAHEINNPVNFIHGNIMILQNYADDLLRIIDLYDKNLSSLSNACQKEIQNLENEVDLEFLKTDIKDLIKSCVEGTQRTKNIVLDLKNFSRMEEMVLTQFDIMKEIDTTLNILNNKYKNRITVVKNCAPDVPKIEAYGGQLNQVFMNILDNAQDAMAETGTLTINVNKVNDNVRIEFIDTGKGIPEENLKKVFDPFFTTKPVGKGTGLGMSISYRVIKDHNGTIDVESEVGKGTKFIITLPINHIVQEDFMSEKPVNKENGAENGTQI